MAIFTQQTNFTEKYFTEHMEALKAIPQEEIEPKFKEVFGFYGNYSEFIYEDKCRLARSDFQRFIEVILDVYQDEECNLTATEEEIDKDLQVVLKPLREGNVLFYSAESKNYMNGRSPRKIVEEMLNDYCLELVHKEDEEYAIKELNVPIEANLKNYFTATEAKVLVSVFSDYEDILFYDFNNGNHTKQYCMVDRVTGTLIDETMQLPENRESDYESLL